MSIRIHAKAEEPEHSVEGPDERKFFQDERQKDRHQKGTLLSAITLPPQPPPKVTLLCSAGSLVVWRSPTAPERSRPPFGLWPSRTSLAVRAKTSKSSPGSCACCFSACAGSWTTQDRTIHSRLTWLSCCLPPLGRESASCSNGFSKLNSPAHRCLCLRFKPHLAMPPARLEARMDSLLSFPVGLLHPLQHAGLSRRSPDAP